MIARMLKRAYKERSPLLALMLPFSSVIGKAILPTFIVFSLLDLPLAKAATTPALGAAATYAVLASTYTNTSAGTSINGDIGFTTGPAVTPGGTHANYGPGAPYAMAGTNQNTALSSLTSQPCTFDFPAGAIDLSTDTSHGTLGVYVPGVYCSVGAMNIGGSLTLNGNGTYIFRSNGALTSTAGASVALNGASACNIFWTPTQATTLAANTIFVGTIIDNAGITVGANVTWTGRALAFGGTVTTDSDIINVTTCGAVSSVSSSVSSSSVSSSVSSSSSRSMTTSSVSSSRTSRSIRSSSSSRISVRSRSSRSSDTSIISAFILPDDSTPPPTPDLPMLPITGADLHIDAIASLLILALALLFTTYQKKYFVRSMRR